MKCFSPSLASKGEGPSDQAFFPHLSYSPAVNLFPTGAVLECTSAEIMVFCLKYCMIREHEVRVSMCPLST